MTDYTKSERMARMAEKRRAEGWGQFSIWTPPDAPIAELKRRFPTGRGGVDWMAVIAAALDKAGHQGAGSQ